ncbi:MAG: phage major capsid protein [Gemmatimonadales bacterium]
MPVALDKVAGTNLADVQETFKRVYLMAVDAVPDATPLTQALGRTRKFKAGPDGLYFNVKLAPGGTVANVPEGRSLPSPSAPKRKQGKVGLAHTYTTIAVGGQSIPLTQDTKKAFVSNLEDQLEDGMLRVSLDMERQYNGDGRGILAILKTVVSAPSYLLEKPYGGLASWGPGTMLMQEGMEVAFINPANGTERGRATVSTVNYDTETVTLSGTIAGGAIGDYVVLCNDVNATGTDKATNYLAEATGVLAVCNKGDVFENIDGGAYRRWNSDRLLNSATPRAITEKLLAQADARVKAKAGRRANLIYTTRGIAIEYQNLLAGRHQYQGETSGLKDSGLDAITVNGRTMIEGDWCPKGWTFLLNTGKEYAGMVDLVSMGYIDLDGAKLHRVEGKHVYVAYLWFPHQSIWFDRQAHIAIGDLIDDATILR